MIPRCKNGPPITRAEIERRYAALRAAMERDRLDALLVCGNQYAGFEGAVRYVSGFEIVHRYAYALLPLAGEPTLVFPAEARWIGDKRKPWVREQVWPEVPGRWLRDRAHEDGWKRLGVVGLDFVMAVRDYRELAQSACEMVAWDFPFDIARAVKSDWELAHIGQSMEAILDGFDALVRNFQPGKTEAEIMAPAVERFFAGGAGPRMMNIVLSGPHGEAEAHFKVPGDRAVEPGDLMLYSLEIGGYEGYWVEFSRPIIRGKPSARIQQMAAAYPEAIEAARRLLREGERAGNVHRVVAETFAAHGFSLGHLSGHSIGLTMLEHPAIGASSDVELREGMIFSLHPQVIDRDGQVCLYTQDTFRVGASEGENLADVEWKFYQGGETNVVRAPSPAASAR
jgi:Xaa-Pro dipeptidase